MKSMARLGYLAAVCATLVVTSSFIGPRPVQAVVATLDRDSDHAARHPFAALCSAAATSAFVASCTIPVPAGQEVVVQTVTSQGNADPGNTNFVLATHTSVGGTLAESLNVVPDDLFNQPGSSRYVFTSTATLYADPGTNIGCFAFVKSASASVSITCAVSGYYVDDRRH